MARFDINRLSDWALHSGIPHWVIADELLLKALEQGQRTRFGPNGTRLRKVLTYMDRIRLVVLPIAGINLFLGTKLWLGVKQKRAIKTSKTRVFVGFGAGSEETIWQRYKGEADSDAVRLNQATLDGFSRFGRPPLFKMLLCGARLIRTVPKKLRLTDQFTRSQRLDILVVFAINLSQYVFNRAFWDSQPAEVIEEVVFVAGDTAAFACVDSGHQTRFLQHGFLSRYLIHPPFSTFEFLTRDEMEHLERELPNSKTIVSVQDSCRIGELQDCVIIASRWRHDSEDVSAVSSFVAWAEENALEVVLKLHPASSDEFWDRHFPELRRLDKHLSVESAFRVFRPKFVASWYSTVLVQSLNSKIIPVTLANEESEYMKDLIFPLYQRSLHWPEDMGKLKEVINKQQEYKAVVRKLCSELEIIREPK